MERCQGVLDWPRLLRNEEERLPRCHGVARVMCSHYMYGRNRNMCLATGEPKTRQNNNQKIIIYPYEGNKQTYAYLDCKYYA